MYHWGSKTLSNNNTKFSYNITAKLISPYPVSIEDEKVMLCQAPFDIIAFIYEKKC